MNKKETLFEKVVYSGLMITSIYVVLLVMESSV